MMRGLGMIAVVVIAYVVFAFYLQKKMERFCRNVPESISIDAMMERAEKSGFIVNRFLADNGDMRISVVNHENPHLRFACGLYFHDGALVKRTFTAF